MEDLLSDFMHIRRVIFFPFHRLQPFFHFLYVLKGERDRLKVKGNDNG